MWDDLRIPVVPVVIFGAFDLYPRGILPVSLATAAVYYQHFVLFVCLCVFLLSWL